METYSEECAVINRLRQDMRGAGKDEMGRNLLYRYYGQLELLELRFPIEEEHVRIAFTWYDAFTEASISQYSLAYEKACVLFNIASILSFTASTQIRTEVEGMKKAYHSLQACAGLLNFINENFLHAPSTDLSREMVKTLSNAMLAQAQEVFTEKQIRDRGKSSIIAKLSAECASLYHNANESLSELVIAGTIDSVWEHFCHTKEKYFSSLAHFYQAIFEEEKAKYGFAVARLTVAQGMIKEATASAKSYSGQFARYPALSNEPGVALLEVLKAATEMVEEKLRTCRKENELIYHETVVKESALPAVARLVSAKAIPLHDLFKGQDISRIIGTDIFQKLIPLSVHESASMYSEEIAKMLRIEQDRSSIADTELSTALDYLGLPKALHPFKITDVRMGEDLSGVPTGMQQAASQIAAAEHRESLASQFNDVKSARTRIATLIEHANRTLDEEARQSETMRSRFAEIWTQAPSLSVNQSLVRDLQNCTNSLNTAKTSDQKMDNKYSSIQAQVDILGQQDLESMSTYFQRIVLDSSALPDQASTNLLDLPEENTADTIAIKVDQVDDILRKLNLVKKERLQTLQDLKDKARKDDISDVLILNKKTPDIEQRVFASELEKFNPHRTRISATISRQEELIEEMTTTFTSVLEDKNNKTKQDRWSRIAERRSESISKFEHAIQSYHELSAGIARAKTFYDELEGLVNRINDNITKFVQNRQLEGRSLLENKNRPRPLRDADALRDRLHNLSFSSNGSDNHVPSSHGPPPPPPPVAEQYRRLY